MNLEKDSLAALSKFAGARYGEEYPVFKNHMIDQLAHEKTQFQKESSSSSNYDSGNEDFEESFEIENRHIPHVKNTEEASEMVTNIEARVDKMQDAISNMDKRMSYNIRLFGSVMYESETHKKNNFKEFNLMKQ